MKVRHDYSVIGFFLVSHSLTVTILTAVQKSDMPSTVRLAFSETIESL